MKTLKDLGFKKDVCTYKTCFSNGGDEIIIHNDNTCFVELKNLTQEIFDAIQLELKKPKLTEEVKQFIRLLPPEIKWAACDSGGEVYAFVQKPYKKENSWVNNGACYSLEVFQYLLSPLITWSDTEPTNLDEWRALL